MGPINFAGDKPLSSPTCVRCHSLQSVTSKLFYKTPALFRSVKVDNHHIVIRDRLVPFTNFVAVVELDICQGAWVFQKVNKV
jgi:hypothetical protein